MRRGDETQTDRPHAPDLKFMTDVAAPGEDFHRGVSAILRMNERILLVHRSPERAWAPSTWDLPGGHVEDEESEVEAVVREIREELGVEIDVQSSTPTARLSGPNFNVAYFVVESWIGDVMNAAPEEHDELRWVERGELGQLEFADAAVIPILVNLFR